MSGVAVVARLGAAVAALLRSRPVESPSRRGAVIHLDIRRVLRMRLSFKLGNVEFESAGGR
jgi:hypothetical protein